MAKVAKTIILLFWFVMMGMLIQRTYLRPTTVIAMDVITQEGVRTGDDWFGIYQKDRKIGYAHTRTAIEGDAYHVIEESEMDILALERVQRISTVINAYTTRNFQLKYFDFTLKAEASSMDIKGAVVKKELVLDILTGGETRKEHIKLSEPIYLTPNLRPAVVLMGLEPGRRYRFPLFNPATMSTQDAFISVEARETIKVGDADQTIYKLKESVGGMEAIAWITEAGETIKEESPLGYSLLRETKTEALKLDKRGPAVDIISLVRIETRPIDNSGQVKSLKARLSNAPFEGFELSGGRQAWTDGVVDVQAISGQGSYLLPYGGKDHAEDLRPTMLIQSDDPNIREQAARIIGKERDARAAAEKINAWVYNALVKQPVVSIPSAVEVLRQRTGDCNEHTTLYTALARAVGIPTRMAAGIVYMKNGFYYHAWPEIWLGDWVAIDPTFNQFPADATHIRFVVGDLAKQAEILKLVGKLKVDVLEYK
jgi:transglutaminase-like putative cysteine protease